MSLFKRIITVSKNNFSNKASNIFNTKLNLYEYFKLPIYKRIQIKNEKKDINLNLYEYFKLPVDKRKNYNMF